MSCPDAIAKVIRKVAQFQESKVSGYEFLDDELSFAQHKNLGLDFNYTNRSKASRDEGDDFRLEVGPEQPEVLFSVADIEQPNITKRIVNDTAINPSTAQDQPIELADVLVIDITSLTCPECDSRLEHDGGCVICRNCGYSKCG